MLYKALYLTRSSVLVLCQAFLGDFAKVWTKLANIDRFFGNAGNVCDMTGAPKPQLLRRALGSQNTISLHLQPPSVLVLRTHSSAPGTLPGS